MTTVSLNYGFANITAFCLSPESFVNTIGCMKRFWCYIGDATFLAATRINSNAMLILAFLFKFVDLLKFYFGPGQISDHAIRKNFTLIYELLDGTFSILPY